MPYSNACNCRISSSVSMEREPLSLSPKKAGVISPPPGKEQALAGGQVADGQAGQMFYSMPLQESLIISRIFFLPTIPILIELFPAFMITI